MEIIGVYPWKLTKDHVFYAPGGIAVRMVGKPIRTATGWRIEWESVHLGASERYGTCDFRSFDYWTELVPCYRRAEVARWDQVILGLPASWLQGAEEEQDPWLLY